ncbi:glutamine-hydrolyzing carbamoyl-phosphate synthase small subunit [Luteibaculum oceani]|uniref:Carbamoyl phosphate synthase small chain n=1 Tax=Luteibaculum oceani TaxID=1294296 RepID=A0A5C6UZU7_9FLAO|nr:glutamine-hydrolyzing carbamoyl-phosphate synthase small subunit [Luteibaculum oceani]TXC78439.1 glutamine-hydrolyzing carbamoyl-phosphate synthase small subunit [Luteibaculum oceani]
MKEFNAVLLLSDGTVFHGNPAGHIGTTSGEICFNTGMTGYQEIFTDPSYFGQIMVTATAHIGNYGVSSEDIESEDIKIAGLVCKKFSQTFSRPAASGSLEEEFKKNKLVGICDVDTRALVRHIRKSGAMNAVISSDGKSIDELKEILNNTPSMEGLELSSKVSCKEKFTEGPDNAEFKVALMDYGVKKNIVRCLVERNCQVDVYPYSTKAEEVLSKDYDGIMLSNGPGDPSAMPEEIKEVSKLLASGKPLFGICLGHQLLALSLGLKTEKMRFGHRGINHPVKNLVNGSCEITSQNHGFVVSNESVENSDKVELTHQHLNDQTVAGISVKGQKAFSVQYHPEASPGPHDSRYVFDQFIDNMKASK